MQKETDFVCTPSHHDATGKIKSLINSNIILANFNPNKETLIHVDALYYPKALEQPSYKMDILREGHILTSVESILGLMLGAKIF